MILVEKTTKYVVTAPNQDTALTWQVKLADMLEPPYVTSTTRPFDSHDAMGAEVLYEIVVKGWEEIELDL